MREEGSRGGRGEKEGRKKKEVSSLQEPNYDEPVFGGEIYSYLLDNRPRTLSMCWGQGGDLDVALAFTALTI